MDYIKEKLQSNSKVTKVPVTPDMLVILSAK